MSIVSELAQLGGVIAAGEYSYRGDRFSYKGQMDEEQARMASIMCRATTMGVHMQVGIMRSLAERNAFAPARGWVVQGPRFTVCTMANVFCFLDNESGSLNAVLRLMRERLGDPHDELV